MARGGLPQMNELLCVRLAPDHQAAEEDAGGRRSAPFGPPIPLDLMGAGLQGRPLPPRDAASVDITEDERRSAGSRQIEAQQRAPG